MQNKNSFVKGTIYLALAWIVFMLSGYLLNIWLARTLGPAEYGIFGLLITLMTALNIMQIAGLPQSLSREVSKFPEKKDEILLSGIKLQTILGLILCLVIFIITNILAKITNDDVIAAHAIFLIIILPLYGQYALFAGYFNGTQKFGRQAMIMIVYACSKLAFAVGLSYKYGTRGALMGFALAPLIALAVLARFPLKRVQEYPLKPLLSGASSLLAFAVTANLQLTADLFLVKGLLPEPAQTGYYVVAQNIAIALYLALTAIGQVIFPIISKNYEAGDYKAISQLVGQSVTLMMAVLLPGLALLAGTREPLIELLFSESYSPASRPLLVLLFGYACMSLFVMLANVINAMGKVRHAILYSLIGLFTTLFLGFVLTPKLGLIGASTAMLVGAALSLLLMCRFIFVLFVPEIQAKHIITFTLLSMGLFILSSLFPVPMYFLPVFYLACVAMYVVTLIRMNLIPKVFVDRFYKLITKKS